MLTFWMNGVQYTTNHVTGEIIAVMSAWPRK